MSWVASDGVPSVRSRLFGRDEEIADARHLLEDGARLVTVTGAGGIGKTRVAVEVCRKISGKVSYLELSGTDEAGLPVRSSHYAGGTGDGGGSRRSGRHASDPSRRGPRPGRGTGLNGAARREADRDLPFPSNG